MSELSDDECVSAWLARGANDMSKEEFRAATRHLWPADWTDAEFDDAWRAFEQMKGRVSRVQKKDRPH